MDVWLIYLIIGSSLGFLAISYKAERPIIGMFSGVLLFFVGLSLFMTNIQMPSGQSITSNQTSDNLTYYEVTQQYNLINDNSGISNQAWGILFIVFGFWIIGEAVWRLMKTPKVKSTESD